MDPAGDPGAVGGGETVTPPDAGSSAATDASCVSDACTAGSTSTLPLPARVSLEGDGCPTGSAPSLTAERIPLTQFDLHDVTGDATTLVKHCLVVHEITIPAGYALTTGYVAAELALKLPRLGRASVKFRSQVNDGEPDSTLTPYEGVHDETVELRDPWPDLDACQASRTFKIETQVSATLRAERANVEPRRMTMKELRFGRLMATRCPTRP